MDYTARVNELKALLETLADPGIVHNRSRMSAQWETFIAHFKDGTGRISGWEISRGPVTPRPPDLVETYRMRRYYGIKDDAATELTFQEQLDEAIRLFRDTHNLTFGAVPVGLRITVQDERMFGSVLVHFAEGELEVISDYDTL